MAAPEDTAMILPRTGIGVDVHAYAPENDPQPLWLGGLFWAGERGLAGHSDGDCVAHAAADALFSACGIGDLGTHFGTDRPEFAGASGVKLLGRPPGSSVPPVSKSGTWRCSSLPTGQSSARAVKSRNVSSAPPQEPP